MLVKVITASMVAVAVYGLAIPASDSSQSNTNFAASRPPLIAAPPVAELPPELAAAVKDFDRAQVRNDIATLSRLVADDYVLINSDASVENKQQYLADFNLPGFRIDPYVMEQPVEKVWGDAAVVGGLVRLSWTQNGTHQRRVLRMAHVWARHDRQWRLTYSQVTRVPTRLEPTSPRDGA